VKSQSINLQKDSIYSLFVRIAIPSSIGTIFQNLNTIVDSIFAGKLISTSALAGIGQTFPIYFIIIALGVGLSIGTSALIANNIGKKNLNEATKIFTQSIILSLILATFVSFFGINYSEKIINSINDDIKILNYSTQYINIIFIGSIFIFILMVLNSCLNAQGDTKSYRNILIFSFCLNIILNPILITGKFFSFHLFMPLGIKGIAIATILSQFVGIFYIIYKIKKTFIFEKIKTNLFYPNLKIIKSILTQGIPASIGMIMIAIGSYIILFFVSFFGSNAIAGYSAATRYEQLFFLPLLGLNTAIISIVGQNYGSHKYDRVLETYYKGLKLGIILLLLLGIIIFISSELVIKLFTTNKDAIIYGSSYLKISAFMFPAFPFFFIANATFQGLKKGIIVMYMAILRFMIFPLLILFFVFNFVDQNYNLLFISLVIMNWLIGIFYFIFSKYKINKILHNNY